MPDMLKVVKGNVEYRIPAHKKKEYLDQGYSVLDESGKVLVEGRPVTLKDYQQRIAELENENIEAGKAYCALYEEHEKLIVEYNALKTAYSTLEASVKESETKSTSSRKRANKANNEADTASDVQTVSEANAE